MSEAPGPLRRWVLAARVRTLPAAIVPVAVGAASIQPISWNSLAAPSINWLNTVLCALIALALQIGTNYANDYSDGVRGTDAVRVGPFRLTASHLVPARTVKFASFAFFGVAALAGLWLASRTSWWFILIGASAIAAGWFYTGGPRPYGYYGFGELFVFVYFGLVATVGTAYVQDLTIPARSWWFGAAAGAAACAMLEANNLRDVDGDRLAGKRTLAARLGRERGSWLVALCVAVIAAGSALGSMWYVGVIAAALYVPSLRMTFSPRRGRELLVLLGYSSRAQLLLGLLLVGASVLVH